MMTEPEINGNKPETSSNSSCEEENASSELKAKAPFIGLVNHGSTCYVNSLMQTLYLTPEFRNMVWNWDPASLSPGTLPYELQQLFVKLKIGSHPVATNSLTTSFGWNRKNFEQEDVQEFWRVMFDALEKSLPNCDEVLKIKHLYDGELIDYVKCCNCNTIRSRADTFQDIAIALRADTTIVYDTLEKALQGFVDPEHLTGENQYHCSKCNSKCDAEKGLVFTTLPPILTIQLKRYTFNTSKNHRVKLGCRCSFPEKLDMSQFMKPPPGIDIQNILKDLKKENTTSIETVQESGSATTFNVSTSAQKNGTTNSNDNRNVEKTKQSIVPEIQTEKLQTSNQEEECSDAKGDISSIKAKKLKITKKKVHLNGDSGVSITNGKPEKLITNGESEKIATNGKVKKTSSLKTKRNGVEKENEEKAICLEKKSADDSPLVTDNKKRIIKKVVKPKTTTTKENNTLQMNRSVILERLESAQNTKTSGSITGDKVVTRVSIETTPEGKKIIRRFVKKVKPSVLEPVKEVEHAKHKEDGYHKTVSDTEMQAVESKQNSSKTDSTSTARDTTDSTTDIASTTNKTSIQNGFNEIQSNQTVVEHMPVQYTNNSESVEENNNNSNYQYELFAVLVHCGTASGGHYYAIVKSIESQQWFCFNDRNVSVENSTKLEEAYGTVEGVYTRNAYLLMYRRLDEHKVMEVESATLPEKLKDVCNNKENESENTKLDFNFNTLTRTYGSIRGRIWYNPLHPAFKAPEEGSIPDAVYHCTYLPIRPYNTVERYLMSITSILSERFENAPTKDQCRLLKFNEASESPEYSFEGKENTTLIDLVDNKDYTFFLDVRLPEETFEEYEEKCRHHVVYRIENLEVVAMTVLKISNDKTITDFKNAIQSKFIVQGNFEIIVVAPLTEPKILQNSDTSIESLQFKPDFRFFFICDEVDAPNFNKSEVYQYIMNLEDCVQIIVNLPILPDGVEIPQIRQSKLNTFICFDPAVRQPRVKRRCRCLVHRTLTFDELREHLAPFCGKTTGEELRFFYNDHTNNTMLFKVEKYSMALHENHSLDLSNMTYFSLMELRVEEQETITVNITLFQLDAKDFTHPIEFTFYNTCSVADVKIHAIAAYKEHYGIDLDFALIRGRKRFRRCLFTVLHDDDTLEDTHSKNSIIPSLCLQIMKPGELHYADNDNGIFTFFRVIRPSEPDPELHEVYLPDGSDQDFIYEVTQRTGIPVDRLQMAVYRNLFLKEEDDLDELINSLNWTNCHNNSIEWWTMKVYGDGTLIMIRDEDEFLAEE